MEFQDHVCTLLSREGIILQNLSSKKYQFEVGENLQGFEIKYDERCVEFDHLSIEVAEKSNKNMPTWTPSGICRSDNSWLYIQGNYEKLFIFAKSFLLHYLATKQPRIDEKLGTIQTFYLEFPVARKYAAKVIEDVPF